MRTLEQQSKQSILLAVIGTAKALNYRNIIKVHDVNKTMAEATVESETTFRAKLFVI
jgi:hypothetical protein